MGGLKDSSKTRVQPVFGAALERDHTGADWLPRLLQMAGAERALGSIARDPGPLSRELLKPSTSKKSPSACFEVQVHPDRRLLAWCVEHPQSLRLPGESAKSSDQKRRALISDDPTGSRTAAQEEARLAVAQKPLHASTWCRFERSTEVDCVLSTDRLVLCLEGKRLERHSRKTTWLAARNQVARNLEAAWRIAVIHRAFAVLVCVEHTGDPVADPDYVREHLASASPHLFPAERDALADAYLGQLTWVDV
jgi:hypothetical protein